ncbi:MULTISPECIES: hypothetical protein [unclassified Microcoleus]|uniref:hypothetical protein n=1 Tax=unclassified Microcoleus TaxID=2642155 RepID=UPI002FCE8BF0
MEHGALVIGHWSLTGSQALPGKLYPEALPRLEKRKGKEAEPPNLRYQAEPGNEQVEDTAVPFPYG